MGMFKPAWMTIKESKAVKAIAAVNQMTGQNELVQVAIEAPLAIVAEAALKRVVDKSSLVKIALNAQCDSAGLAAVNRMDDQALDSFVHEAGRRLKEMGVSLSDELLLLKHCHDGEKGRLLDLQRTAFERIENQETLMRLASDAAYSNRLSISQGARKRLDEEHRKRFVLASRDADQVAEAIADGFADEAFLRHRVVLGAHELPCLAGKFKGEQTSGNDRIAIEKLLVAALSQMHDEDFLLDVALAEIEGPLDWSNTDNGWFWPVREAAVWHITDEEKLFQVTCIPSAWGSGSLEQIIGAAISRMHDEALLQKVMEQHTDKSGYRPPHSIGWMASQQLKSKGGSAFYRKLDGSRIKFEGSNWDSLDA